MILQPLYKSVNTVILLMMMMKKMVVTLTMNMRDTGFKVQHAGGAKHALDFVVTQCFSQCFNSCAIPLLFGLWKPALVATLLLVFEPKHLRRQYCQSVSACVSSKPWETCVDVRMEIFYRERNADAVFFPSPLDVLMSPAQPQGGAVEPCYVFKSGSESVLSGRGY